MAKNSIRDFDSTAANNTDIQSTDISEGCAASGINNAIRELMADIKDVSTGAVNLETPAADRLDVDNIRIDGNTISSTDTNGDITLDPNGTGDTIIASGNVGIGTSSPTTILQLKRDSAGTGQGDYPLLDLDNGNASGYAQLRFADDGTEVASILSNMTDKYIAFRAGGSTERMRIQANGCVSVGVNDEANTQQLISITSATNTSAVDARSSSTSYTGNVLLVGSNTNTTNSTYNHIRCDIHGEAQKMAVRDSGNLVNANNSYGSLSDSRLKENIVDAASQWDDIKAVQVRKYNRLGETQKELGVIAQELEASGMGGLVEEGEYFDAVNNPNEETRKSVKYSVLYMKAIKALQEAMTRIETLETEMTALEARVTALEDA